MTASLSEPLLVAAELTATPTGDRYDDATYDLAWAIRVGGGGADVGPAGPARLRPPKGGLEAWFDYAQPSRLLAVRVPFGSCTEDALDLDSAVEGSFGSVDRAVLELLLGADCVHRLEEARGQVRIPVDPMPAWHALGRVALLETYLDRTAQPADGLWAIEEVGLLYPFRRVEAIREWAGRLLDKAGPVLKILPTTWADQPPDDEPRTYLERDLLACRAFGARECGPLAQKLQLQRGSRALAEAASILARDVQRSAPLRLARPAEVPLELTFRSRGQRSGNAGDLPITAFIDFSAEALVEAAEATRDGPRVRISARIPNLATLFGTRLETRVSTRSGRLLAGALSMAPLGHEDRVGVELTLPASVSSGDVVVVVGRHLPVEGMGLRDCRARQATETTARALDLARKRRAGESLSEAAMAAKAQRLWNEAGDARRAAAVETLEAPEPFLPERLWRYPRDEAGVVAAGSSSEALAAQRSLAWSIGELTSAARLEAERVRSWPAIEPLPSSAVEALAIAAATAGDTETAAVLSSTAAAALFL